MRVEASGEGTVYARDIICDADVEILNPDLVIATLEDSARLFMEITVAKGRGYASAERNKKGDHIIGVIPVDSVFTPVSKVNYTVENTRVGQISDYDKLTLEVWTDGSIRPDEATSLSAKILNDHLRLFIGLTESLSDVEIMVEKEEEQKDKILRNDHRGTGPFRPFLQLPEACRDQHGGGANPAQRRRHDENPQPGQEIPGGSGQQAG